MTRETISINGLTLCHKHSDGFVRSTLPDVCKSPITPVPYTNVAFARDLADGTTTVLSHGGAMNGVKGSRFARSIGDEPGVGGGVKSGTHLHEATFLSWSPNVFMEGRPVTRLTDKMLLNKGNTISAGGYYTGPVQGPDRAIMDRLCFHACNCKQAGTARQSCVEQAIMTDPINIRDANNGLWPELTYGPDGSFGRTLEGMPSRRRGVPGNRLDVTQLVNGEPKAIFEMKFKGDRYREDQWDRYDRFAESKGLELREIEVETDCTCTDDGEKQPVTVPASKPSEADEGSFATRHPYVTAAGVGALAIGAGVATWYLGGAGAAAVLGTLGAGTLAASQ